MSKKKITIIGLGKVGTAWLNILPEINYAVYSVFSRNEVDTVLQKKHANTLFFQGLPERLEDIGDFIFLAISDDAIEHIAEKLASNFSSLKNKYVLHCSGVLSSKALNSMKQNGAQTASFHPIKAITKNNKSFEGIWFDMEGDEEFLAELERLCRKLGAHTFQIKPEAKPYLHASAVVASNYLVVLADMVKRISAKGDIKEEVALKALSPLMKNTLANIEEFGTINALTGPIARGDVQTVESHLHGLQNDPNLLSLYKILGKSAVEIAKVKSGNSAKLIKIMNLLS